MGNCDLNLPERLKGIRRGDRVTRFHTEYRTRSEDVGQHVSGALGILFLLTGGDVPARLIWALRFHDAGEYKGGDLPAPAKRALSAEARVEFNVVEESFCAELGLTFTLSSAEAQLLKVCDILDGLMSCAEERARGNRALGEAFNNYYTYAMGVVGRSWLDNPDSGLSNEVWENAWWIINAARNDYTKNGGVVA